MLLSSAKPTGKSWIWTNKTCWRKWTSARPPSVPAFTSMHLGMSQPGTLFQPRSKASKKKPQNPENSLSTFCSGMSCRIGVNPCPPQPRSPSCQQPAPGSHPGSLLFRRDASNIWWRREEAHRRGTPAKNPAKKKNPPNHHTMQPVTATCQWKSVQSGAGETAT